jgi:hypothetical protein
MYKVRAGKLFSAKGKIVNILHFANHTVSHNYSRGMLGGRVGGKKIKIKMRDVVSQKQP